MASSTRILNRTRHILAPQVSNTMSTIASIGKSVSTLLLQTSTTLKEPYPPVLAMSVLWLYLSGSFCFDAAHYLLHQSSKSRYRRLRRLGYLHQVHHLFYNRNLKFDDRYYRLNLLLELPMELSCQMLGTLLGWLFAVYMKPALISRELTVLVLWFEVLRAFLVVYLEGKDSNHIAFSAPPKDTNWFFVGPHYHALHHVDPTAYMSSTFRLFDWIRGTGNSLKARRITITDVSGAFGLAMKRQLRKDGVEYIQELKFGVDWTYDNYDSLTPILATTDVLVLTHDANGANAMEASCHSAVTLIDLFKKHHKSKCTQKMLLPEVWYVGSESELHSPWDIPTLEEYSRSKRSFVPHARALYDDPAILYRHIMTSTFQFKMRFPIVSADWAAWLAMWWIRRGARYVPVTYTGLAHLNYFKFMYWVQKAWE